METAVWLVSAVLLLLGLLGAALPALPGAPLIFAAAVLHKMMLPQYLSWWTIALLACCAVVSVVADALLGCMGGRLAGATPSGVLGSGIGAVVGLLGGPFGMIAGAFLGAALAEVVVAKRPLDEAAKAGLGAGLGFLAGTAAKTMLAAFMVLAFLIDCFVF